jgi:hypothetical protein
MARHHAELPLDARRGHLVGDHVERAPLRRHDLELDLVRNGRSLLGCHWLVSHFFFVRSAALAFISSMLPTR